VNLYWIGLDHGCGVYDFCGGMSLVAGFM